MDKKHNFVQLAEVQQQQGTLYCGGLDPHSFGPGENEKVYQLSKEDDGQTFGFYMALAMMSGLRGENASKYATVLAGVEQYIRHIVTILVVLCNIRVFKPQAAFYEQFGPAGMFLLMRIRSFIDGLAAARGIRLICLLDCKRGDIQTTQSCYFLSFMGNLLGDWGVDFAPYDLDIINVNPWLGKDSMVLVDDKGQPDRGLNLMRAGKGIIGVSKSSNPSGPDYQELFVPECRSTVQMKHARDAAGWSKEYDLEYDGLSTIGLVVGSTHTCDGSIREVFPGTTMLVPGFGAQGGDFPLIMQELIRTGKWNGQGALFSSSRGTMYAYLKKYGGSGQVANLEQDLVAAVKRFRENEFAAFQAQDVKDAGIKYPFTN